MQWLIAGFALGAAVPASGQQAAPARDAVNVTVTKQRKMLVEGWVNGLKGTFLVDTGAGNSYLGERFAESLNVPREEGGYSYNVMGSMRFDVVDVGRMELGRNRIPMAHTLIHVSNLGWVNNGRVDGNSVNGIIGADILIHNQAVIDCGQGVIRFGSPGGRGAAAPRLGVNFISRRGDELAVVARVNGVAGTFIVDTGYNVSMVSPEFAMRLSAGGQSRLRVIGVKSMEFGTGAVSAGRDQFIVSNRIGIANQGYIELGERPYDGVLGMDFLLGHHAVIDCRMMQLRVD